MYRVALFTLSALAVANGFHSTTPSSSSANSPTQLAASRRDFLAGALLVASSAALPNPAAATYSAYSHREEDWQSREKKGEIQYSNARALRKQLREIVPQNNEGTSKVFCPNGPSAAVSPLMENKCSDVLMATPSVYGRTQDIAGNSILGFNKDTYTPGGGSSNLMANPTVGGFPAYYKK